MKLTDECLAEIRKSKLVDNLKRGVIEIDNSEFSQHVACEVMGLNYGALKRVPARSRTPLLFGTCVHAGIEALLKGEGDYIDKAIKVAVDEGLDQAADPKRNTERLETLLRAYALDYNMKPSMQFEIVEDEQGPMIERSFKVPLGNGIAREMEYFGGDLHSVRIEWIGKIDVVTKYEGKIAAVDHKTTSVMGTKFVDDKLRSSQMMGYAFTLSKLLPGKEIFGVRINALAVRASGYEFRLWDVPIYDWKLVDWEQEVEYWLSEWMGRMDRLLTTGEVLPSREHCVTKYGRCPYFDVCDAIPQMRDAMLFNDEIFYVSDWSPLK